MALLEARRRFFDQVLALAHPAWLEDFRDYRRVLRARNAASGGEEMLRLRAYEKLQNLVSRGMVKKVEKKYKGVPKILATLETFPPKGSPPTLPPA